MLLPLSLERKIKTQYTKDENINTTHKTGFIICEIYAASTYAHHKTLNWIIKLKEYMNSYNMAGIQNQN